MKKILMISPFFFNYETRIKNELENKGYKIILYSDFNTRKINFIKKKIENRKKENRYKYYNSIFENEKSEMFDYIFIIKGIDIPKEILLKLKSRVKEGKLYSYQWDDINNGCKEFLTIRECFKKVYTYSYNDAKHYNFIYRPFFFSKQLNNNKLVDIAFIGSYSLEREKMLNDFFEKNRKLDIQMKFYLVLPKRKILKLLSNLFNNSIKYKIKSFSYDKTIEIFSKSKAILELQSSKQNSITTRSIEALGIRSKIISSSEDIVNKDFYSKQNYILLNEKMFLHLKYWLERPYEDIDNNILKKYELENWVDDIFSE